MKKVLIVIIIGIAIAGVMKYAPDAPHQAVAQAQQFLNDLPAVASSSVPYSREIRTKLDGLRDTVGATLEEAWLYIVKIGFPTPN